ncbi:DNA mismatch repair protein MutS [Vulcanibacillus modesticaldus]|uniref:DNA mismatch repair protein MutS n=1 Tax=Vulcanibacillus modesticaldus TaxID=337097 RepID=A0A1D2YWX9_9BACI|nr:DNA mismatch repair protein MutS [Vulcanibacillus modesticaldus]OEG00178.1 DNA mismatch repair protein MutS [Vulcanibacillus modesticaldus]
MAKYTPMIQQYLTIKQDYQDAFLFFRLGDFYEMFFEDAKLASKILEITLTGRDGGTDDRIPMCGIPYHSADTYISKLIDQGYKVAICEQVEDPKAAKGVVKREVVRVITPGTLMEGKVIDSKGNNYIGSVIEIDGRIGLSVSDITTGEFYATDSFEEIDDLMNELNQYQPTELVIEKNTFENYKSSFNQIDTTVTVIEEDSFYSEKNYYQIIKDQFSDLDLKSLSRVLMISSGQLLSYLHKTQQKKLEHFNQLQLYDSKKFMTLDQFSKRNLELIQTSRDQNKKGSLLWLLDQTETAMGSRLLRRWLEKPLLSINAIEERLAIVEELFNDSLLAADLSDQLSQIYDIERLISKVTYGNATPRDLYNLRKSLERVPDIYQLINESKTSYIKKLVSKIDLCQDIAALIEQSIQDDPPISSKDGGVIKRGYDKKLDSYYLASTEGKEWLQNLERRERELTGIKSLKVGFNKVFGYYIEVTKSNLSQVPGDRYIRKQTLANSERYITEELKAKEAIILEAEEKMLDLEYKIFTTIREKIATQNKRLQSLAHDLAMIDVLLSFAKISSKYGYVKPNINQEGKLQIEEGRHPVIEAVQNGQPFIPNDTFLDQEYDQILLITGPNMAGKSTYMRQVALIVIMAQIGCFVPAKMANIGITDRIFTRIGAGDDLTSGQSTFMVEMLETKQAITQATSNSLILLDEIGRGTSTYDGMALAQAIIQYIHDHVKAKTLFSTHYHELTSITNDFPRMKNIHVSVIEKDGKVIFLHKIKEGKADKSYGIHVAELAGMPHEVVESAKKILKELESKNIINNTDNIQKKVQGFSDDIAQGNLQLELFNNSSSTKQNLEDSEEKLYKKIANEIKALDLLNLTPMEGFQFLYDIQKRLRK